MDNSQAQHSLLTYLRHELCTPINVMLGYSDMLLEELQHQQQTTRFSDIQKIRGCSQQLLTLVSTILDPAQLEMSQVNRNFGDFSSTLRIELITPLSTIIGYCEMLLEDAPAELIPDLDRLNTAAQQLLKSVNDIIHLTQPQLRTLTASTFPQLLLESPSAASLVQSATTMLQGLRAETSEKQSQGGMILAVDDNPANCDLLARQLKRQGYAVATATNAQQALRLLKAIPYDLILLDVVMPGMNGIELLEQIKCHDQWQHIPVIMLTALDELESAVKCIELGAEDYLHKPSEPTLLKARIGTYLEKKRLRDQEVLYLQQVDRLTTAAAAIELKTFEPDSLSDLAQQPDKLGQLVRVFQRMAQEVTSREQRLEQQIHLLQVAIDDRQKQQLVTEIATTDHFQQLQKRIKGNTDIQDFVPPSFQSQEIRKPEKFEVNDRTVKRIVVHSYRGGTGKSSITSNLAISLARQGHRVGIVDTDLQSPGIHTLFGLEDNIDRTLNDYLHGQCALYEAAYDLSHLLQGTTEQGAVYLVPASVKAKEITRILQEGYHQKRLLDGFNQLAHDLQLDFLLIDTHPGVNEETLQAIAASHTLMMVLRPDYQDYQGTAVLVELARLLSVSEMRLVVNKALPLFEVETYRHQLRSAYEVSVAEILPFSEEMMHLASSEIFSMRYPNHPFATAIESLVQQILK